MNRLSYYFGIISLIFLTSCSSDDEELVPVENLYDLEMIVINTNEEPVANATLTTTPVTKTITTNAEGYAVFEQLAAGAYDVKISVPDDPMEYTAEVTVSAEGENRFVVTTSAIDPVEDAPVDYENLLASIYDGLKGPLVFDAQGYVSYWGDIGADVCYVNPSMMQYQELDRYTIDAGNAMVEKVWNEHYRLINRINYGIDHLQETATADPDFDVLLVEAKLRFMRGLLYFNLVRIYGNPVLVTTAKVNVDNPPEVLQGGEYVYDQIIKDLLVAKENLESVYDFGEISIEAAEALLGKVYLQSAGFPLHREENYAKALEEFQKLENTFNLEIDYAAVFDPYFDSTNEIIFELQYDTQENMGNYGVFWGPQGQTLNDGLLLVPGFADSYLAEGESFENPVTFPLTVEDSRFYQNVATFTVANNEPIDAEQMADWRPYKFRKEIDDPIAENGGGIDFPLLRLADILLMTAEAENAVNGPTSKAYAAINRVRERAYDSYDYDLPPTLNATEFLNAVLDERKRELAFEGQRKDDLVRNEMLEPVIEAFNAANPQQAKDFQPHEYIWPIPQAEVDANAEVSQNPGY